MADGHFKVDGLATLAAKLDKLPLKVGYSKLRKAGRYAMKPVLKSQQDSAHEDTGDLKASIGIRAIRGREGSAVVVVQVGPIRKKAKGRTLVNVNQKAIAQEYGNKRVKADPFIRPSLEQNQSIVLERLKGRLRKELEDGFK